MYIRITPVSCRQCSLAPNHASVLTPCLNEMSKTLLGQISTGGHMLTIGLASLKLPLNLLYRMTGEPRVSQIPHMLTSMEDILQTPNMTQWRPQASRSSHISANSLGEQQYRSADSNPGSPQMSGLSYDHQMRRPVYPYIPAHRAHSSDAFTGYSEPLVGSSHVPMRGLYSQTQFDTLSILSRVHNRPDPKIELGPVDDSVSFVVVDATQDGIV